jgi:hypothetical protein
MSVGLVATVDPDSIPVYQSVVPIGDCSRLKLRLLLKLNLERSDARKMTSGDLVLYVVVVLVDSTQFFESQLPVFPQLLISLLLQE